MPAASARKRGGGYYLDDGPGEDPPDNLDQVPDATPRLEPLRKAANRPYEVFGRSYVPRTVLAPYRERGIASWYGRRYHGRKTSSGEPYDMYGMTAAHATLPIPSYARVTNPQNGRSVVVRVNDRGPFHADRLIDLSYTAAWKLGTLAGGSAWVEVEAIIPDAPPPGIVASAPAPGGGAPPPPAPPAAEVSPPAADPGSAVTDDRGGLFVQLAAFGTRENAEDFLGRVALQLDGIPEALRVSPRNGLFRVHLGPYPSEADARRVAERVAAALGFRPMVTTR